MVSTEGPAYLVIDDNANSWWHTNYTPKEDLSQSLTLDLNEIMSIGSYRYLPRPGAGNGTITKYELQVSLDNEHYTTIAAGEWALTAAEKTLNFDPVRACYVRLVVLDGKQGFGSAAEVNVHYAEMKAVDHIYLNNILEEAQALSELLSAVASLLKEDGELAQKTMEDAMTALLQAKAELVDHSVLRRAIEVAQALPLDFYQEDGAAAMRIALANAKEVYASGKTKFAITKALYELQDAQEALVNDYRVLQEAIAKYDGNESMYTTSSWAVFKDVLAAAKTAVEDKVSAAFAKEVYDELTEQAKALELRGDTTALNALIQIFEHENLVASDYTSESWAVYEDALQAARDLLAHSDDASVADVKIKTETLQQAHSNLKKASVDKSTLKKMLDSYVEAAYTTSSWALFNDVYQEAQDLYVNNQATLEQITKMIWMISILYIQRLLEH